VGTWKRVSGWGNFDETWDLRADGSYLIKTGSAERSQAKKHGTYAFEDGILSFFWIRDNTRSFGSDRPDQELQSEVMEITLRGNRMTVKDPKFFALSDHYQEVGEYRDSIYERVD
jgi:hypothetical protein